MIETLDSWIRAVGPLGYLVLFGAALVEYVVPPFPGDAVVLLGGVYAVRGNKPWALVFAAVTLGSIAGSAINYFIGQRVARRFPKLNQVRERMKRGGIPLIAFNRFLPGVRGFLFAAAGAAEMSFPTVMFWGGVSSLMWNALIMGVGIAVGGNIERLGGLLRQYNAVAWGMLAVGAVVVSGRYVWRLWRRPQVR
jgi:membrane protein DedA with SNARE-associated domain